MRIDLVYESAFESNNFEKYLKELNFDILIIARKFNKNEINDIKEKYSNFSLPVKFCHIISSLNSNEINSMKNKVDFLAVRKNDLEFLRKSILNKVDLILHPIDYRKTYFDSGLANLAFQNNVKVAFLFEEFLNANSRERIGLMKRARLLLKILIKAKVKVLFFSGSTKVFSLRSIEDLKFFASFLGLSELQANHFIENCSVKLAE